MEALGILCVRYARCERERGGGGGGGRDRDRRKWRHHCRAEIGDEFTLSLAKNSHLLLPSHFSFLPSQMVTIVVLKFAMSSHFPLPNNSHPLFRLSQTARRVIEDPRKMVEYAWPILDCSSHRKKWIKLIPRNRRRNCFATLSFTAQGRSSGV